MLKPSLIPWLLLVVCCVALTAAWFWLRTPWLYVALWCPHVDTLWMFVAVVCFGANEQMQIR